MTRRFAALGLLLLTMTVSGAARAQSDADRAQARALYEQAQDALHKKDFAGAADLFARADTLYHAPTLTLGYARAEAGLGKLVAAHEAYTKIIREGPGPSASPAFAKAVEEATKERQELAARLPSVVITVAGPRTPVVTIDGERIPAAALGVKRFVDPGSHTVHVTADGFAPADSTFTIAEGASVPVSVTLTKAEGGAAAASATTAPPGTSAAATPEGGEAAAPDRGASTRRTAGFVLGGLGVVSLGVGVTATILMLGKKSDVESACPNQVCRDQAGVDAAQSGQTLSLIGTITVPLGVVALGTGAVLILTAHSGKGASAATTSLSTLPVPGGIGLNAARSF